MHGMRREGRSFAGEDLYELYDHFGDVTYADKKGDNWFNLAVDWTSSSPDIFRIVDSVSYTGVYPGGVREPDYEVALSYRNNEIVLSHGWKGATYHEDRRWRLGEGPRSVDYSLRGLSPQTLGVCEALPTLADIEMAIDERLMLVFGKLADADYANRYALTWADMAAMFAHVRDQLPESYLWVKTPGRGAPLGLELSHPDGQRPSAFWAQHTRRGWVLREMLTSHVPGRWPCPWWGNVVFRGNHSWEGTKDSCPYPGRHGGSEHFEFPTVVSPWLLGQHIKDNWLEPDWL